MSEDGKKKDRNLFIIAGLVILAAAVYWGREHYKKMPENGKSAAERSVSAAMPVEKETLVDKNYIGYVTPINEVEVRPYINGFVSKVKVSGGAEVKKGDVLVILDQAEYKARLDAAKAAVAQAEATFNNSSVYYERMKKAGPRAVSQTDLDNAKASFLSAEAALEQARASEAAAQVNYDYTVIKATIDGVVGDVALSAGDYVSPESVLLTVIQYNPTRVVFSITDKDYLDEAGRGEMFADETIRLRLANGKIYDQPGTFRYTDNQVDKTANSIAVYADFDNPDKLLAANAYVNVLVGKKYRGIVVGKDLVYLEPEGSYIYTADGGVVRKTAVDILSEYGNNNYILEDSLKPGEVIVVDKLGAQDEGKKFKIVMEGSAAAGEKN